MNLFDLAAKITLDTHSFETGIKAAVAMGRDATETVVNFVGNVSNIGVKAAKTMGTVAAAGTAGIAALTKSAVVDYYGEAEQLIGGVETLFGAGGKSLEEYAASVGKSVDEAAGEYQALMEAQQAVFDYANGAYKTAGLSANEYMSTVTSFSASLIKSLEGDTKAAAEYADKAITDMADNANKFGSDLSTLQTAYAGFAKDQFQLLDNLKLGYGGTRAEMKRLIKDAEKISGKDLSIKNYSDIIEAIHIIQEDMGITGATAAEAADTIQGSMNAASSALKNLMAGLADENADLEKLTGNVVEGVSTAAKNIVPRVKITLGAIAGLADTYSDDVANFAADMLVNLTAQAPQAAKTVTKTVKTAIKALGARKDDMAESAEELFSVLLTSFEDVMDDVYPFIERLTPTIANGFLRGTGTMFTVGTNIIMSFVRGLASNPEQLTSTASETVNTIVTGISDNAPELLSSGITILTALADGISVNLPTLLPAVAGVVAELATDLTEPENIEKLFASGLAILQGLADGLTNALPILLESAPKIAENLVNGISESGVDFVIAGAKILGDLALGILDPGNLGQIAGVGLDIISSIITGLVNAGGKLLNAGGELFNNVKEGFLEFADDPLTWGKDLIDNFISGVTAGWDKLKNAISGTAQKIKDFLGFSEPKEGPLSNFHTYAPDMMDLFIKGIKDNEKRLTNQISKTFDFGEKTMDFAANGKYTATVDAEDAAFTASAVQDEKTSAKSSGNNITINITVEGGEYESETALAEEIARVLQKLFARKEFA